MLKIRLSSLGNEKGDFTQEIPDNSNLRTLVLKVLEPIKLQRPPEEVFHVLVNGHIVDSKDWDKTVVNRQDDILIAPQIHGGDSTEIFKSIVIIAATVISGGWAAGVWGAGTIAAGLATAAITIGTSLILNALIPPPVPDSLSIGGSGGGQAGSQAYNINAQSNRVNKFGLVPKVYGSHRMFPLVAANPYIQLEVDKETNKYVQYLYAVYDFGLGPAQISDIRIGDTPIGEFSDVQWSLVDFNKPTTPEGNWDKATINRLTWYKGDIELDSVSVSLNGNSSVPGTDPSTYETVRNSAPNPTNDRQEIIIDLVNSNGLFAYSSTGEIGDRSIVLGVQFAPVGTENWVPFNDLDYVENFTGVGGDQDYTDIPLVLAPQTWPTPPLFVPSRYGTVATTPRELFDSSGDYALYRHKETYGLVQGQNYIYLSTDAYLPVLKPKLQVNGKVIGTLSGIYENLGAVSKYYFNEPINESVGLLTYYVYTLKNGAVDSRTAIDAGLQNKVFRKQPILGRFKITRRETAPAFSMIKFTPKNTGQFKVKITRIETISTFTSQFQDNLSWIGITTRFDRSPIKTLKRHTFLEVRIKATNQLNGTIQNLSAEAFTAIDVWNGSAWVKQLTSNPAWIFVDLLTGEVNKRAIPKSRLHLPSIIEWANFCDEVPTPPTGRVYTLPRFSSNFILDFQTTLQGILNQVANAAQASLNIVDGKYGVLIDKRRTIPIQVFTPRNSWGFNSVRNYVRLPHAVKVKYIDPASDWEVNEAIVYDDGYDASTATEFDDIQSFAVTNAEQAWRFGRYLIAQNKLRQENISINVDFEHLVCTRGDFVRITHDVMKVGGTPARVKTKIGSTVTIDDSIETLAVPYGYMYRSSSTGQIITNTLTIVNSNTFTLNGSPLPEVGDLIVIGAVGSIYLDCIVKSIAPNDDLSATITLVEKADAIYDYESTSVLPSYSPQISLTKDTEAVPPGEVQNLEVIENSWEVFGSDYQYYVTTDWDVPTGSAVENFEVYVDSGLGYDLKAITRDTQYKYIVDPARLGLLHKFKVLAVSAFGKKLQLGEVGWVEATPIKKLTPPSDVESLDIDITGEVLQLFWPQVTDPDIKEYLIRYSPTPAGTWETSIPLLRTDGNTTLAATQARTGTYLIKAVDFNNNESYSAATAITTIPTLFGLNVVSSVTDFPDLEGDKDRTVADGGTLVLQKEVQGESSADIQYYSEGFYYYKDLLDLGDIYTVRLQSLIQAEGYTLQDIMSEWVTLESISAMANSKFSEWDVETQYRTTETFLTIADWSQLDLVTSMSAGEEGDWSAWRKFTVGDGTGRIFQFRLRLISRKTSVSPRVFDGTIKADMPDRIESYHNLNAPSGGLIVTYDPAFKGPTPSPSIGISIDAAESGDYWAFEYRNLTGFKIRFYDKNDIAVARQFDAQIKGWGRKANAII